MTGDDLSAGDVSESSSRTFTGDIQEEQQRRLWKGRAYRLLTIWATTFAIAFFVLVIRVATSEYPVEATEVAMLALLGGLSTVMLLALVRMVQPQPRTEMQINELPWLNLLKELIEALRQPR